MLNNRTETMSSEVVTLESFSLPCVPEGEDFEPTAEELENLYQMLENGNVPELQWQCPGRRAPSPIEGKVEQKNEVENAEKEAPVNNDFDFMDDVVAPQMRVRNQNSTPKSAKKKTANFAGVIDALKKQMQNQKDGS